MAKVIVNAEPISDEKAASLKKRVADALGILEADVVTIPGVSVSVIEVPAELTKAREKADKEAEHAAKEAEKAAKEAEAKAAHDADAAAKAAARAAAREARAEEKAAGN